MQLPPQGVPRPGPGINMLPTPPCTLKVNGIPSFVTQADFSRLMLQLEGCTDARLLGRQPGGDQVGYAEFGDKMNASKAKNLYHGWTGWGGRGLAIELVDFALSQLAGGGGMQPVGQKRLREGEDLLQPDGGYKQARADVGAMGVGGLQQPGAQQQALGLLQNLLQQQPGIAQQLLASAQQQAPGMPQQGQGYAPAPIQAQQQPLQPQYAAAPVQQQYGMQPQQQPVLQQQQPTPTYAQQQPVQQQQQPVMLQQPQQQQQYGLAPQPQQAQQQYGLAPQPQQPMMMQGGMLPQQPALQQQQPVLQQQQQPQMMAQPQPQLVQQPQGVPVQGGRRGDIVAPAGMRQYPPDACNTLYIEGMPSDVTRRELAHVFRAHEGFRSLRLVIKDSKKHAGEKLVMAFAEFTSTYFATEAMDRLQGYPFDLDDAETMTFFVKYARPMDHPPRRGPPASGPPGMGRGRGGPPPQGGRGMAGGGGRGGGRYGQGGPPREGFR